MTSKLIANKSAMACSPSATHASYEERSATILRSLDSIRHPFQIRAGYKVCYIVCSRLRSIVDMIPSATYAERARCVSREPGLHAKQHINYFHSGHVSCCWPTSFMVFPVLIHSLEKRGHILWLSITLLHPLFSMLRYPLSNLSFALRL